MSRPKIHIIDVDDPLFAFRDLVCRCQVVIHNAEVKYYVQSDIRDCMLPPKGTCLACWDLPPEGDGKRRYEYGICEAQEARDADREEMEMIA